MNYRIQRNTLNVELNKIEVDQVCRHDYIQLWMVSTLEQMQVQNGTEPGARRSKRPPLASRTRCKWSMETLPELSNDVKNSNKVKFGKKVTT